MISSRCSVLSFLVAVLCQPFSFANDEVPIPAGFWQHKDSGLYVAVSEGFEDGSLLGLSGRSISIGRPYSVNPTEETVQSGNVRADMILLDFDEKTVSRNSAVLRGCQFNWAEKGEVVDLEIRWTKGSITLVILASQFAAFEKGEYPLSKQQE